MPNSAVRRWLLAMCLIILAMIGLGGVTRLTQSGLSMVTWEPLMGAIPPLNEAQWQARFDQYRQFPEYQKQNRDMTLPAFKKIFFWEYLHRLVGRLIGAAFLLPFLWFLVRRQVGGALAWKLGGAFLLGGLQGFLGWYMVKSGLVHDPRVSHLRLAAHLSLALLLLAWLYWLYLDLRPESPPRPGPRPLRRAVTAFLLLLVVQIVYGAFVAGLDAGLIFNTFPKMLGFWIPPGSFAVARSGFADLIYNPISVQWLHRALGILAGAGAFLLWGWGRRLALAPRQRFALRLLPSLTLLQVVLGIVTLLRYVPVTLGVWHQVNAALLLLATLALAHALRGGAYHTASL